MPTFSEAEILQRATSVTQTLRKSATAVLTEEASVRHVGEFDVFLSHSSSEDAALILGVKKALLEHHLSVYVDQFDDPQLTPADVTWETADILRKRMRQSKCLLFLHSEKTKASKWMPWELGYFDGLREKVAIIPVTKVNQNAFRGQEYLGLYPYVDAASSTTSDRIHLWINYPKGSSELFSNWLKK